MKYFVAACAFLAVASAVPIHHLIGDYVTGMDMMGRDVMDVYKTGGVMGGMMGKYGGMYTPYNPMYRMWSSFGGMPYGMNMGMDIMGLNTMAMDTLGMGYMGMGTYRPEVVHKYGLMGKLNDMIDVVYGVPHVVDDVMYRDMNLDVRNILTDKMICYTKYGIKGCHMMMMHMMKTMVPEMMDYYKY